VVIHPPVDTQRFSAPASQTARHGFVIAGRQVPHKKIALAITACNNLSLPLTVIGRGPEHSNLVKLAGPTITFLTEVSDREIASHFAQAEAFIFPSDEDFGIVAVEALAAGTPLIAYKEGGALDFVNETTGLFFSQQTTESLEKTLKAFPGHHFDHQAINNFAEGFSEAHFKKQLASFIDQKLNKTT
jgi:glycosyltransferase involved in cell wall biosynthesis